jgi:hypothetical protein
MLQPWLVRAQGAAAGEQCLLRTLQVGTHTTARPTRKDEGCCNPDPAASPAPCLTYLPPTHPHHHLRQVITDTVTAAMSAPIPPGCTKKVWLCDDGGDPEKKAFMAKWGPQGGYVTGRSRKKGEMNGKSCNVNNVLRNHIFSK